MEILEAAVVGLVICGVVAASIRASIQRRRFLQQHFDALRFDTPAGVVNGAQLEIVKRALTSTNDGVGLELNLSRNAGGNASDEFWYCVGPGPCYFVVIPVVQRSFAMRASVQWIVRPLTEARMRGSLITDRKATRAAFGDA